VDIDSDGGLPAAAVSAAEVEDATFTGDVGDGETASPRNR